jgi:endonuclease/exonuclease/phosphatase family metal-dependent hydrolase
MSFRILFSNIGYARGIDGSLWQHISRCPIPSQQQVLMQLKNIIQTEHPDLCCFVEIDSGSRASAGLNQLAFIQDDSYIFSDIADKYGADNWRGRLPLHSGKSSAFLSKTTLPFDRLYFKNGSKRLIHGVLLPDGITLFFCHFSLSRTIRRMQFAEMAHLAKQRTGPVIIMADFNIHSGFSELQPLLEEADLDVLSDEQHPTFTFHRHQMALDLCLCSRSLRERVDLRIIPQPFSDHAAIVADLALP